LKGAFEALDVGIKFADMVLEPFDPALLLSKALATFSFAVADKFRNVVGQPLVLHVANVGKGSPDGSNDSGGEGSRMQRWPCRSVRHRGGVKETGGSLDEVSFPRNGEEGGCVLFLIAVANILSDRKEVGVAETVLIGRIGSIRDGVSFACDVRGAGRLTGRLSHSLGGGVVPAVDVATETGVLESVFSFGGVDVGLG